MLGVATLFYSSYAQTLALEERVVHTRDVIHLLDDVLVAASDVESGSRGYVITGNAAFIEQYATAKARIDPLTDDLERLVQDNPVQIQRTRQLKAKLQEQTNNSASAIAGQDRRGFDQATHFVSDLHGIKVTGELRPVFSEMRAEEERLLLDRTRSMAGARSKSLAIGVAGVMLSLIIIVVVFESMRREALRRMKAEAELSALNRQASENLHRAERLLREKRMISRVAGLLHNCNSLEEASEIIRKEVRNALSDLRGAVYLFRESRNVVEVLSGWNEAHTLTGKSFAPEECWALRSGSPHLMRSGDDMRCEHIDPNIAAACLCVPMIIHGELIGVIVVEGDGCQFDESRQDLIRLLVDQIGMSLATLRVQETLRDQTFHDPLTGLFNRRYLEVALAKEVSRADRHRETIGFVIVDLDHFKSINDRYGHEAGDLVLKHISEILRSHGRVEDIACRYGGEEFLLVLPGASVDVTSERAEMLRGAVQNAIAVLSDGTAVTETTISVGIAIYPTHGSNWHQVVGVADKALYSAKERGRNRVVTAEAPKSRPTPGSHTLFDHRRQVIDDQSPEVTLSP